MQYIKTKEALLLEQWNPGFSTTPSAATSRAAGFDLFACILVPVVIEPGKSAKIGLGVKLDLKNFAAFLLPTSGGRDYRLKNTVGLIDPDYQGEIIANVKNTSEEVLVISPMEKIAQLILFFPVTKDEFDISFEEVAKFDLYSERGEKSFGQATSQNSAFSTLKEAKPTAQQAMSFRQKIYYFLKGLEAEQKLTFDSIVEPVFKYIVFKEESETETWLVIYPEQKLLLFYKNKEPQLSKFVQDFENCWKEELEEFIALL